MVHGCSIIRRRGETVLIQSEGLADPTTGELVSPATRFQIASISKGFTAAAVLRLFSPFGPNPNRIDGKGRPMGFKYELKTADGDEAGSFESTRCDWQAGDELIAAGNVRYRVTAVVPQELVAEFVDRPLAGILEVEPLECLVGTTRSERDRGQRES